MRKAAQAVCRGRGDNKHARVLPCLKVGKNVFTAKQRRIHRQRPQSLKGERRDKLTGALAERGRNMYALLEPCAHNIANFMAATKPVTQGVYLALNAEKEKYALPL